MAISIVHSAQTSSTAATTLTITSATANNLLVCFIGQSAATSSQPPTLTGWTVNSTGAAGGNPSNNSVFMAYKVATGGETSIAPTAGGTGAVNGICYWELNGATSTFDTGLSTPSVVNTPASVATLASNAISTNQAGSIILFGLGGILNANGGQKAWTGTNVANYISTGSTFCFGGSFITTTTLSSQTFTANWTSNGREGMLAVAFQAAGSNHFLGLMGVGT